MSVIFITSSRRNQAPDSPPGRLQIKQSKSLPEPESTREPSAFAKKIAEAGAQLY
jgi:hypothetical protein